MKIINNPIPALTKSPDNNAPKEIAELTYKLVIIIEEAQLGIRPIKVANIGVKYLLKSKKAEILFSPIK